MLYYIYCTVLCPCCAVYVNNTLLYPINVQVSVDVHITKEDVGSDEHVVLQEEQVTTEQVTEETVTEVEEQVR